MKKIDIIGLGNSIIALIDGNSEDYRINDEIQIYISEVSKYIYGDNIDNLLFPLMDIVDKFKNYDFLVDDDYSPFTAGDKEIIKNFVKKINSKVRKG